MSKYRAVFLDLSPLDQGDLDLAPLQSAFAELTCHKETSETQIVDRLQGAEVAIVNKVTLSDATLAACPDLKLILVAATGVNNIDLAAAKQRGIAVCNCQAYGTATVAQHTLMLLLALATRLPDYQAAVARGRWQESG